MAFVSNFAVGFLLGIGLIMAFVYSENRRAQARQRLAVSSKIMAKLSLDDAKQIFRQHSFPPWVVFSDYQKVTWLNHKLEKVWPFVDEAASALIKESMEPILEQYKPPIVSSLKIKKFTLGTVAPQFVGVQVVACKDDEIVMQVEMQWNGNPSIILTVETKMGVSLPIQGMIKTSITDTLLWPMRQVLPIIPGDYSNLALQSIGLLGVKLIQAKDLLNKDALGKSDPFALLYIRPIPSRMKKSKTVDNQLNPIWNEHFEFEVEDLETQKLTIRICDEEGFLSAQLLGYAEVPLKDMEAESLKDLWVPLVKDKKADTKNRGQVRLELLYSPFKQRLVPLSTSLFDSNAKNSPEREHTAIGNGKNDKASPVVTKKGSKHIFLKKDSFVRGVLCVTVIRAEDLIVTDYEGKADPYVVLTLKKSDQKKRTRVIYEELNPVWNQTLDFVVEDAMHELLVLEVWDHDTFGKDYMGGCALSLTKALLEGEYDAELQLDAVKSGKVFLHIKWLPQPLPHEGQNSAI